MRIASFNRQNLIANVSSSWRRYLEERAMEEARGDCTEACQREPGRPAGVRNARCCPMELARNGPGNWPTDQKPLEDSKNRTDSVYSNRERTWFRTENTERAIAAFPRRCALSRPLGRGPSASSDRLRRGRRSRPGERLERTLRSPKLQTTLTSHAQPHKARLATTVVPRGRPVG